MATIKEIAVKTGYSPSTVSIVLRGQAGERSISAEAQERIMECARELNYSPNVAARRLRENVASFNTITVYWANDFRSTMVTSFWEGVQHYIGGLSDRYEINIHLYEPGKLCAAATAKYLGACAGAIICNAADEDQEYIERLNVSVPIVLYNRMTDVYPCVCLDNRQIGRRTAQILIDHGCTRGISITGLPRLWYAQQRSSGFMEACVQQAVPCEVLFDSGGSVAVGRTCADQISDLSGKPGFFVNTSDRVAIGLLQRLTDLGVRFPQDAELITVGAGDPALYGCIRPSPTVIQIPLDKMAYECARIIDTANQNNRCSRDKVIIPVSILQGDSAGPIDANAYRT
ncbi:MAG: LacI family DNA-binding transcriptional regulator [Clostridia bacterium]|nr:LacI family DNA-binding transcriptional regulator [Clostridia bacterium]